MTLSDASNNLIRLLLDPLCPGCRRPLARPLDRTVCDGCWDGVNVVVAPLCERCGDQLAQASSATALCRRCIRRTPAFSRARSAGAYEGSLRELIHAFKFEGRRQLAEPLSRLMCRRGLDVLEGADAVVPVPLHTVRLLRRGFNQADDLAQHLKRPVWRVLRRTRHGPPQATLSASRRETIMEDAFATRLWSSISALHGTNRQLRGATLVLVDDVMTTGATAEGCSRALMDAGAKAVRVLTVARAVTAQPSSPPLPHRLSAVPRR